MSRKLLAISSGGGHWVQLLRLAPAFQGLEVHYATVHERYRADVGDAAFHVVRESSRWSRWGLLVTALQVFWLVWRERPDFVLSTGAAPGYFGLRFGRLLGARTLWVDSIANAERLSLSGEKAGRCADLWLTQWAHLSRPGGPRFEGALL